MAQAQACETRANAFLVYSDQRCHHRLSTFFPTPEQACTEHSGSATVRRSEVGSMRGGWGGRWPGQPRLDRPRKAMDSIELVLAMLLAVVASSYVVRILPLPIPL